MLEPTYVARSLCEDWDLRRSRLARIVDPPPGALVGPQLKILDALLQRYRNAPEGARPARFPTPEAIVLRRREIVLQHHLSIQGVVGVRSEAESRQRVGGILQRLKSLELQKSAREPGDAILTGAESDPSARMPPPTAAGPPSRPATLAGWMALNSAVRSGAHSHWDVYRLIEQTLRQGASLPECALEYLAGRAGRDLVDACQAAEFLLRCRGQEAAEQICRAWRNRGNQVGVDHVCARLATFFRGAERGEAVAGWVRAELASDKSAMRMEAARVLAEVGTLDDVGLLLDLLSIPPQPGDEPGEREAVLRASAQLAEVAL